VLELMTAVLTALLNLSTLLSNQPKLAKRGLMVLLKTNASLFEVISCRVRLALAGAARGPISPSALTNVAPDW
jgi:hypothetical protein